MDVNAMHGLVTNESDTGDKDDKDVVGKIKAIQGAEVCFFCKKNGHLKKDCRKYEDWTKKNPFQKSRSTDPKPIFCYNCGQDRHIL